MKKIKYILIIIIGIIFIPKNVFALSTNGWSTNEFTDNLTNELNKYYNYTGIVIYSSANTPNDNTDLYYCLLNENKYDYYVDTTNGYIMYREKNDNGNYNISICPHTSITYINQASEPYTTFRYANWNFFEYGNVTSTRKLKSSIDLKDINGNTIFTKNINYTPQNNNECQECEECEICEGGSNMDYTNYIIMGAMLLSVFIWLMFFKWCFKIRREKNDK